MARKQDIAKIRATRQKQRAERRAKGLLVSTTDQEAITGLPQATVRDLALSGKLPYVEVGRRIYLKKTDLHAWIEKHTVTA
jgi:excisionase family DNA binding protein